MAKGIKTRAKEPEEAYNSEDSSASIIETGEAEGILSSSEGEDDVDGVDEGMLLCEGAVIASC